MEVQHKNMSVYTNMQFTFLFSETSDIKLELNSMIFHWIFRFKILVSLYTFLYFDLLYFC